MLPHQTLLQGACTKSFSKTVHLSLRQEQEDISDICPHCGNFIFTLGIPIFKCDLHLEWKAQVHLNLFQNLEFPLTFRGLAKLKI